MQAFQAVSAVAKAYHGTLGGDFSRAREQAIDTIAAITGVSNRNLNAWPPQELTRYFRGDDD
jgi:hypothetical protein